MTALNTKTTTPTQAYYSTPDIANHFRVSINTIRSWLHKKQMPQPDIRRNKFNRWKYETIKPFFDNPNQWLENNKADNKEVK